MPAKPSIAEKQSGISLTPDQKALVAHARALAAARPVIDETTAVIVALCNELSGQYRDKAEVKESSSNQTVQNMQRFLKGKR
jgi:hypothetical protein